MKNQINKSVLIDRLQHHLDMKVGMQELNTLIYGWTRKNETLRTNIHHRTWLYYHEVQSFSEYIGYDLLKME